MKAKPTKKNPLVLGAEVYSAGVGVRPRLGTITRVTKTLLTVKWASGHTRLYGRTGKSFNGRTDESGEAITHRHGEPIEDVWGGEDDEHIYVVTDSIRENIAEDERKKGELAAERRREREEIESDPRYQARQKILSKYGELLGAVSGNIEDSWGNKENFRIELENIPAEQLEALVEAIRACRATQSSKN